MTSNAIDLVVRDLSKAYGHTQAAVSVNITVCAGEIFGLLGPNGAGKTTVVESILGLVEPDAGSVEICGIDARRHTRQAMQKIGATLQSTALQDKITAIEALQVFGALYARPVEAHTLLRQFDLEGKATASYDSLSGGQKQRLGLALACVGSPQVLVLDEPTAGLDPIMRREFHAFIRQMRQDGRSILLTTHDMEEAELLSDRIAVIDHGRIIAEGSPQQLIVDTSNTMRVTLQSEPPLDPAWFDGLKGIYEVSFDGQIASFTTPDAQRALEMLLIVLNAHGAKLVSLRVFKATLEDVILKLTGSKPPKAL